MGFEIDFLVLFPDILPDCQVSADCRYHKISKTWSKGFFYDTGNYRGVQGDRLIAAMLSVWTCYEY